MPVKIRAPKKKETLAQKVTHRYDHLKAWIADRRKVVLGALISSIVIGGLLVAFVLFTRHAEEKAWVLEAEASHLFHDGGSATEKDKEKETRIDRITQAAQKYEALLEKYPSRRAAAIALYKLGHVYFELEKYDLAEAQYLKFIQSHPLPALLPLVHLRMGYLYNKKENTPKALNHFRAAYETLKDEEGKEQGSLSQDQAGFELARMLEKADKKPEAMEIYKKISTTFSESPWGMEAQARLTQLAPGPTTTSTTPDALTSAPVQEPIPMPAPVANSFEPVPETGQPTAPQPVQPPSEPEPPASETAP